MPFIVEYDREDDGRWIASVNALPGCLVYGASREEARKRAVALALSIVSDMVENGEWTQALPEVSFAESP